VPLLLLVMLLRLSLRLLSLRWWWRWVVPAHFQRALARAFERCGFSRRSGASSRRSVFARLNALRFNGELDDGIDVKIF
jgi:hypothetical protein